MEIPLKLKAWAAAGWAALGVWLMKHALTVFAAALIALAVLVLFSGKKSQDTKEAVQQAVSENVLTKKQVKAAEKIIKANNDSIRTQTIIIRKVVHVRDSAVVAARHHEAKADSILNSKPDEDFTAPTTATVHVERFLTGYKPGAYSTAWLDSIR
jgi:hypothetical protein